MEFGGGRITRIVCPRLLRSHLLENTLLLLLFLPELLLFVQQQLLRELFLRQLRLLQVLVLLFSPLVFQGLLLCPGFLERDCACLCLSCISCLQLGCCPRLLHVFLVLPLNFGCQLFLALVRLHLLQQLSAKVPPGVFLNHDGLTSQLFNGLAKRYSHAVPQEDTRVCHNPRRISSCWHNHHSKHCVAHLACCLLVRGAGEASPKGNDAIASQEFVKSKPSRVAVAANSDRFDDASLAQLL